MAIANIRTVYPYSPRQMWELVTGLKDCSWRSDLSRIEVAEPGRVFVEYTGDGSYNTA